MDSFKPMQGECKCKEFCLQTRLGFKTCSCYVIMHMGPLVKSRILENKSLRYYFYDDLDPVLRYSVKLHIKRPAGTLCEHHRLVWTPYMVDTEEQERNTEPSGPLAITHNNQVIHTDHLHSNLIKTERLNYRQLYLIWTLFFKLEKKHQ